MSKHIGGDVTYDDHASLNKGGASYAIDSNDYDTELLMVDLANKDGMTNQEIEAHHIAKKIQKLVHSNPPLMIYDKQVDTERAATYKDFAILLRTMSGWSETFVEILSDYGIPVKSHLSTGYFEAIEIQTILSALTVVDNPKQDIPLLALMRSPMFGFSADDLMTIRLVSRDVDFHTALMTFYNSILGQSALEVRWINLFNACIAGRIIQK